MTVQFAGRPEAVAAWKKIIIDRTGAYCTETEINRDCGIERASFVSPLTSEQREVLVPDWYETKSPSGGPWNHCVVITEILSPSEKAAQKATRKAEKAAAMEAWLAKRNRLTLRKI